MKAAVVFESMFGNTRRIAEAIAEGMRDCCDVTVLSVRELTPRALADAELVVVGGPTHVHGMSRPSSRNACRDLAAKPGSTVTYEPAPDDPGLREVLASLAGINAPVATFDTRLRGPGVLTGRASLQIARRLRNSGSRLIAQPQSFFVDRNNALRPGELERARAWGAQLAASVPSQRAGAVR